MTNDFADADADFLIHEAAGPVYLSELPPSAWRSLGKRLDYTYWADRDRFVELDSAIMASRELGGQWTPSSRSVPAQIEQSDRTDDNSHAHVNPDHLEILLKQLRSAACDLRPAA